MTTHVPRGGLIFLCLVTALMGLTFVGFNRLFDGPGGSVGKQPYLVTVQLRQTGQLLDRSLVMVNGVKVGEVVDIDSNVERTVVTFSLDPQYAPLHEGANVQLGTRTWFAEAYLRLDRGRMSGPQLPSGAKIAARASVEADEALDVLDRPTRAHLQSVAKTVDRGIAQDDDPARLRETTDELTVTVEQVRRLTEALDGQQADLGQLVAGARTVAGTLADRDRSIRGVVTDGATTMRTLGDRTQQLEGAITEANRTLGTADAVLRQLPGLIDDTQPAVEDLAAAARELRPAVRRLTPTVQAAAGVVDALPQLTRDAEPALTAAKPIVDRLEPLSVWLVPTLRNIIPVVNWVAERRTEFSTILPLINAATNTDSTGRYLRLHLEFDQAESLGTPARCENGRGSGVSCSDPYPTSERLQNLKAAPPTPYERLLPYPEPR